MRLSFMSWVCRTWTLEEIATFASDSPYDGVELRVNAGHDHGVSAETPESRRREIASDFADHGLEIPVIASGHQLARPDASERAAEVEAAIENIELAGDLGAQYLRVFAGGDNDSLTPAAAKATATALDEIAKVGEARGVTPLLEVMHDIVRSPDDAYHILGDVESDNVGLLWNRPEIDPETYRRIQSDVQHVHLHDPVLDPSFTGVEELLRTFADGGYGGYFSLEIIREDDLDEDTFTDVGERLQRVIVH